MQCNLLYLIEFIFYRSENKSLPTNHKKQGMESIIPEPIILTFPTKSSAVVYTNDSKLNVEENDSEVSSNDEHILNYSIQHPIPTKPELTVQNNYFTDDKILGLIPPPKTTKTQKKYKKFKKPRVKKVLKKVKVNEGSNDPDLFDVLSPITSFFIDDDDVMDAPTIHNFFNIKMTPSAKLKTTTVVDKKNSNERVHRFQSQNYRRTKRNMKGVDLQKPKERKLNISATTNVSISSPTARIRMYTPRNGTWFRDKRDHISVNVDVRRKEPRYYYHTERPRIRVKRVVYNPPLHSRSSQVFSSKYLVTDQEKSESLPEEINVAFSTTPRYETTPKFLPAIAFGDSKTKIINYNDSVANSTNDIERTQLDKKGSLIYVINPDTGLGKWMQVIKVKNEEDTKTALTNGPVYLEKKAKDGVAEESIGKFGFKGSSNKELFKNVFSPTIDHRFKFKFPSKEPVKNVPTEQPKKPDCPKILRPRKKEVCIDYDFSMSFIYLLLLCFNFRREEGPQRQRQRQRQLQKFRWRKKLMKDQKNKAVRQLNTKMYHPKKTEKELNMKMKKNRLNSLSINKKAKKILKMLRTKIKMYTSPDEKNHILWLRNLNLADIILAQEIKIRKKCNFNHFFSIIYFVNMFCVQLRLIFIIIN